MKFYDFNGREISVYEYVKAEITYTPTDLTSEQSVDAQFEKLQSSYALLIDLLVDKKIITKADVKEII